MWIPVQIHVNGDEAWAKRILAAASEPQPLDHLLIESEMARRRAPLLVRDVQESDHVHQPIASVSDSRSYVAAPIMPEGLEVFVQEVIAARVTAPLSSMYDVPSGVVTRTGLEATAGAPLEMITSRVSSCSSPGPAPGSDAGKECLDSRSTISSEVLAVA